MKRAQAYREETKKLFAALLKKSTAPLGFGFSPDNCRKEWTLICKF